jgi:ATPase family associated with various cellular activities (AAA)
VSGSEAADWFTANQNYLMASLAGVRAALKKGQSQESTQADRRDLEAIAAVCTPPPALIQLCELFGLSPFERDLLVLCAGSELDSGFAADCAEAQGDTQRAYPTFGLALAVLDGVHWSAITPAATLRFWRLIEVVPNRGVTTAPIRLAERVLHYLTGVPHLEEQLAGIVRPLRYTAEPIESHRRLAERLVALWSHASEVPIVQLVGEDTASKQLIAAAACAQLGLALHTVAAHDVPTSPADLGEFLRLWEREARLTHSAMLLNCDGAQMADAAREGTLNRFIDVGNSPLIVSSWERRQSLQRQLLTIEVQAPSSEEQRLIWHRALEPALPHLNGRVDTLISHFHLGAPAIDAVCTEAFARQATSEGNLSESTFSTMLWDICREQARPRLDDLAQRIEPAAGWDDLVLPEAQYQTLRDVAAHVRQRTKVYEDWGFAGRGGRGLGISALFAGASGTGKTMAAEVIARELQLDLYRIDLSSVVSKYIGETEKNLRRVFDAAEAGGTILLFDEADALFGKRSEVKDSHDRYANMEVSYLLQRMEAYRGLAVLTTNFKDSVDTAFLRRIRFIVRFPFPDASQRAEIWRRIFPKQVPRAGIDNQKLARLNVAGGNIRNIALNAAFLAAEADEPVTMKHLLSAARSEYVKLERTLTDAEVKGWT